MPRAKAKKVQEEVIEETEFETLETESEVQDELIEEDSEELEEELEEEEEEEEEEGEQEEEEEESPETSDSASEYEIVPEIKGEIIYPDIECSVYDSSNPLTVEVAQKLLGWTESSKGKEFQDPHVTFEQTGGVYLSAVVGIQRAIMPTLYERYAQEILRRNWAGLKTLEDGEPSTPNGEPVIMGKTGRCLDGMHRLLGLIFAQLLYDEDPDAYPGWEEEPIHLPTILVSGISENIEVVNTINTGKDRKLSDALHASGLFSDFSKRDMKAVCKAADFAIKTVWDHIGVYHAYGPRKSHSEALDFLLRHPRIIEAVKYCYAYDKQIKAKGITSGALSALMYLMGASKTKQTNKAKNAYYDLDPKIRNEKQIDFSNWKKAEEFVADFANGNLSPLETQILKLTEAEDGKGFGIFRTVDRNVLYEKTCLVFKAWSAYLSNAPITAKTISLKYKTDDEGEKFLAEEVILSGIDLGIFRKEEEQIEEDE